jgi:tetratricopeptide (TPR) repeat protein
MSSLGPVAARRTAHSQARRVSVAAFATSLLASLAITPAVPTSLMAQERFDHWGAIEAMSRKAGGFDKLAAAPTAQVEAFADQLLKRGQTYFDLYEFHRVIARDYSRMLDSADKAGGPSFAASSYFLGRALHELGDMPAANAAYKKAMTSAPARLRTLATEWSATASGSAGKRWQQDLVDWRSGKPVRATTCPAGSAQCALFEAILAEDVATLGKLQADMSQHPTPDYVETQSGRGGDATVEFYDPLTFYLLGAADFVVAAKIGAGKAGADAWRGVALLRSSRFKDAEALLKSSAAGNNPLSPLLGEAKYRQGDRGGADQVWKSATGVGLDVLADVKSALGLDSGAVARLVVAERQRGLDRFQNGDNGGVYLARALVRFNMLAEAEEVLAAVRPLSQGSRLTAASPSVLALTAHAEYRRGRLPNYRDRYSFARNDLAGVAAAAPVVGGLLRQLQELTLTAVGPAQTRGETN